MPSLPEAKKSKSSNAPILTLFTNNREAGVVKAMLLEATNNRHITIVTCIRVNAILLLSFWSDFQFEKVHFTLYLPLHKQVNLPLNNGSKVSTCGLRAWLFEVRLNNIAPAQCPN